MNEQTRFNLTQLAHQLRNAGRPDRAIASRLGISVREVRQLCDGEQRPAPAVQQPLVVATRDANFYDRPDARSAKRWHIATTAWTAACQPGSEFRWGMTPLCEEMVEHSPERIFGCRVSAAAEESVGMPATPGRWPCWVDGVDGRLWVGGRVDGRRADVDNDGTRLAEALQAAGFTVVGQRSGAYVRLAWPDAESRATTLVVPVGDGFADYADSLADVVAELEYAARRGEAARKALNLHRTDATGPDWSHEFAIDADNTWSVGHPEGCPGQTGGDCDVARLAAAWVDGGAFAAVRGHRYRCTEWRGRFALGDRIEDQPAELAPWDSYDDCGRCVLVAALGGPVRVTQADCPTHGINPTSPA